MDSKPPEILRQLTDLLQRALLEEATQPTLATRPPDEMRQEIAIELPEKGVGVQAVVEELVGLAARTPRTTTPRFYNQLFSGRLDPAFLGEILAAFLNNSMYTYKAAGPHTLIENALIDHMASAVGMEGAEGSFQAGGSLSNLIGLLIARNEAFPSWREDGPPSDRATLFTSEESHYSIGKSVGILGLGRSNLRRVAADERGRMRPEALREAIQADLDSGHAPFAVNATAGTTVLGAFDPLDAIADVCQEFGLWMHVDGAFGASVALSPRRRPLLHGLERAHSLSWDAHKMMGVPLPCSVLLVHRRGLLRRHLEEDASYLFQADSEQVNPGLQNIHCGRRNDALKLWAAWRALGDAGWEERIERLYALSAHAVQHIQDEPRLQLVQEPTCITVCFTVSGADCPEICRLLDERGKAKLGYGTVRGEKVIRLVTANPETSEGDLDQLLADILELADEAPLAGPSGLG